MAVAPNNQDLNEVIDDGEEDFSLESIGLTEEEISLIPMVTDIPAGESCTVCLTSFEENPSLVCRLACNHLFHEECLLPWLQMNVTCPLCRHRLTDRQQLAAFETEDIEDSWSDEDTEDSWSADDHVELWRAVYEGTWSADENFGYDRNEFGVFGSTGHDVSDQRIEWYSGSEDTLPMNLSSDELQSEELNEDEPSCDDELDISMLVNSSVIVMPPGENLNPTWLEPDLESGQLHRVEFDMGTMQPLRDEPNVTSAVGQNDRSRSPLVREENAAGPSTSSRPRRLTRHTRGHRR